MVCYALGRIGRFGPRATAALIAGAALLTVYVVPFLKYPANPPAVGNPDTIGKRTTLFFLMVALSVLLAVAAVIIGKRLAPRLGNWNATTAAGAGYVVVIGLAYAFLPSFDEVGKDFPASLLWEFRLSTLAVQTTLWTVFGLVFGYLTERVLAPAARTAPYPCRELRPLRRPLPHRPRYEDPGTPDGPRTPPVPGPSGVDGGIRQGAGELEARSPRSVRCAAPSTICSRPLRTSRAVLPYGAYADTVRTRSPFRRRRVRPGRPRSSAGIA
ncbi:hypothetical protein SCALM49S_04790 [Streptomyces californicus]